MEILQVKIIDDHDDACSSSDSSSSDDEYDDKDNNDDIVVDDDYANYVHLASNVKCLNRHLKVLRVENYSGRQSHLDFASLIIAKARVLETVTLVYGIDFEDKWIEEAQKQFFVQNGASKMLRVEFVKESGNFNGLVNRLIRRMFTCFYLNEVDFIIGAVILKIIWVLATISSNGS